MTAQSKSLVVYEIAKGKKIEVPIEKDSVWLSVNQIAEIYGSDRSNILKHIHNIYSEKELIQNRTYAKIAHVQLEGKRKISREIDYYNLDLIISVGYRVNSRKATQFRIWATKTLRDYILKGYAINKNRLVDTGMDELERAVNLIKQTINSNVLTSSEAKGILKVITDYASSWIMFHKYDEGKVALHAATKPSYELTYSEAIALITELTKNLISQNIAAKFVGMDILNPKICTMG